MKARLAWFAGSVVAAGLLIVAWQIVASADVISPVFLPSPAAAGEALLREWTEGDLVNQTLMTIERMGLGWLLASIAAVAFGVLISMSPFLSRALAPTLQLVRPLPASAIVPAAIATLGLTESMILTVIVFGSIWPVLLATIHGMNTVEPRLFEVARTLRLSAFARVFKIALPSALPDIFAGMRLGLTAALILTIVGEMLTSRDGLGQWLLTSGRGFQSANLFAGILLLSAIGVASALLLAAAERRLLRWNTDRPT